MKLLNTLILFCLSLTTIAQTTIIHHEIANEVAPAEKIELFYSNTGFAIDDFHISETHTLIFSQLRQTFFLLDNNTHIVADRLQMETIPKLKRTKQRIPSVVGMNTKAKFDSYLRPMSYMNQCHLRTPINDTMLIAGTVSMSHTEHFIFYIGWTSKGKLFYKTLPLPVEDAFTKPLLPVDLKFDRYYILNLVANYPETTTKRLLTSRGNYFRFTANNNVETKPKHPTLYALNENDKYKVEYTFEKLNFPISIEYNNYLFIGNLFNSPEFYRLTDSNIDTIAKPGVNYFNHFATDPTTNKLYLISSILRRSNSHKTAFDEQFMRRSENEKIDTKNKYELDIYEFNNELNTFEHKRYLRIEGNMAHRITNSSPLMTDIKYKIHGQTFYFNIPDYSSDHIGGIYKVNLKDNDSIVMEAPHKTFYSLLEFPKLYKLIETNWQAFNLTFEPTYYKLGAKTRKQIDAEKDSKAKYKEVDSLLNAIEEALMHNNPGYIQANLAAYDKYAMTILKKAGNSVSVDENTKQWTNPLKQLIAALRISGTATVIEFINNTLQYTTPDGWHCTFVKIDGYWYFYYQFEKTESYFEESSIPELPQIE